MRFQFITAALVVACFTTTVEAVKAPTVPIPATSAATHHGWWFEDKDGDGHCAGASTAVNASTRPSGMKAKSECSAGDDTDDTNRFVSPSAPVIASPTAADKAAWTLGKTLAQTDQATPAFAKMKGQVEACEASYEWLVYEATCDCGAGYRWYSYQDPVTFVWYGACDEAGGPTGRPSDGVDSKARKLGEENARALEDQKALNEAAHAGLVRSDDELRAGLDANTGADLNAWEQYRIRYEADFRAKERFEAELVENETEQNDEIKGAQITADRARSEIATEAELRGRADEDHGATHAATRLGFGVVMGSQSLMMDSGVLLRDDGFRGFGLNTAFGGQIRKAMVMAFLQAARVSETSEVAGKRVSVTGFDFGGGLEAGGNISLPRSLEISLLAFGGGGGSVTGSGATQSQVVGFGPLAGGAGYFWYQNLGLGLRVERYWEVTGHSVVFQSEDQEVLASDLLEVPGDGTANTVRLELVARF